MKKDKVGIGLIIVSVIVIILMLSAPKIMGVTRNYPVYLPETADSIFLYIESMIDGTIVDSQATGPRTNANSYDTTITLSSDSAYNVVFSIWYPGSDSAATWIWREDNTIPFAGSGTYTYTLKVLDTLGTDSLREGVKVTVANTLTGGTDVLWSDATGTCVFKLDSMSYTIKAKYTGYVYDTKTDTITANETDTIEGYNIVVGTAGSASLCRVTGYAKDAADVVHAGATIEAVRIKGENATVDTSGTAVIVSAIPIIAYSDTTGYFFLDLRKTTNFTDTTKGFYNITGTTANGKHIFSIKSLYVPDISNFNLGDSLAGRE